jgi:hypothetical protein
MNIALTARQLYEKWVREQTPYRLDPLLALLPGLAEVVENNEKMLKALMVTIAAAGDEETSSLIEEAKDEPEEGEG